MFERQRPFFVEAIQRWNAEVGEPPTFPGWLGGKSDDPESGVKWPDPRMVATAFGSWNNAIAAAGFEPRKPNGRGRHCLVFAERPMPNKGKDAVGRPGVDAYVNYHRRRGRVQAPEQL